MCLVTGCPGDGELAATTPTTKLLTKYCHKHAFPTDRLQLAMVESLGDVTSGDSCGQVEVKLEVEARAGTVVAEEEVEDDDDDDDDAAACEQEESHSAPAAAAVLTRNSVRRSSNPRAASKPKQ